MSKRAARLSSLMTIAVAASSPATTRCRRRPVIRAVSQRVAPRRAAFLPACRPADVPGKLATRAEVQARAAGAGSGAAGVGGNSLEGGTNSTGGVPDLRSSGKPVPLTEELQRVMAPIRRMTSRLPRSWPAINSSILARAATGRWPPQAMCCPQDTAVKNQAISLQFGGDPEVTYNVTLHVRGVEGCWYTGGLLELSSRTFYTVGVPTVGGFSSCKSEQTGELPFMLPAKSHRPTIAGTVQYVRPDRGLAKQHYYLNSRRTKATIGHRTRYVSDYSVTIRSRPNQAGVLRHRFG